MLSTPDDQELPLAPAPELPAWGPAQPLLAPPRPPGLTPHLPRKRRGPMDIGPVFLLLATAIIVFPLLHRAKLDHCPNDASRWNTVFFLVEHGTYAYRTDWKLPWNGGKGKRLEEIPPERGARAIKVGELSYTTDDGRFWGIGPFWSIDMIKIGENYYSSKPPLLATGVAGVVWLLYKLTPWTFVAHPYQIMRTTVLIVQVMPFLVCLALIVRDIRRQSDSPFVRNFCIAAAALGTYLTPYAIPLNNHVIAACTAMFATWALIRIWYDGRRPWYLFALAGFFAGLAASLELTAAAFLALVFLLLLVRAPGRTLLVALPAMLIPIAAYLYTNYLVVGSVTDAFKPLPSRFDENPGPYFYPGSYWHPNEFWSGPQGMDALHEPNGTYLMHMLVGHHGFFLLTPIFIIALLGIFAHWFRRDDRARPLLATLVLVLSAAVTTTYAVASTHNYGGVCQGFRWLFWLIPLWLLMLPAGVELLARARVGRLICHLLLGVSLLSVLWALPQADDNQRQDVQRPWSNSWAHELFRELPWPALKIHY